jgi:hypothetical protein
MGRVNDRAGQQPMVSVKMCRLRPFTFFSAAYPRGPPASVVFTDCLSMMPADGLASRPSASRMVINSAWLIRRQRRSTHQA